MSAVGGESSGKEKKLTNQFNFSERASQTYNNPMRVSHCCFLFTITAEGLKVKQNKFVRPRWPYDMRPSARAEKYIRDAGP